MNEPTFATLKAGWGYDESTAFGVQFGRAASNLRVRLAEEEYAKPGHVICYTDDNRRLHVPRGALTGFVKIPI